MTPDLDNEYIVKRLREEGFSVDINSEEISVFFYIDNKKIALYTILDDRFPYEFPKIRVKSSSQCHVKGLPHVNWIEPDIGIDTDICCFNETISFPDINSPNEIIISCFIRAKNNIIKGIRRTNKEDILDEYCAYWNLDTNKKRYLLSELSTQCEYLYCSLGKYSYIHKEKQFLIAKGCEMFERIDEKDLIKCLYIPLSTPIYFIPQNHKEVGNIIKNNSNFYKEYCSFIQGNCYKRHLIVLSQESNYSRMFFGFIHNSIPQLKGFRKGYTPLPVALMYKLGTEAIEKFSIVDLTQKRLFFRGGDGLNKEDIDVSIIGCGSLGSYLSNAFASCGVSKFKLVDNDSLRVENIARHLCGFKSVGLPKVQAIKNTLLFNNPNINCQIFDENVHCMLENQINDLKDAKITISTAASAPVEKHLIDKYNQGDLDGTIAIMWVEPYALCGHIFLLNKPQDIFGEFYNSELQFNDPVIVSPDSYYKREAGCQSTYMPYSGLNVNLFASSFVKDYIRGRYNPNNNYHIIWTGDLKNNSYGVEIYEKWNCLDDNSVRVERIK